VIPAPFELVRAGSLEEALDALASAGEDAKLLAGGMSLLPLMKLRLATPSVLVDVGRLDELRAVRVEGDEVVVGALCRHADLERSPALREAAGVLAGVAAEVGDPQVRHRGTIGGSVAHADPASDLPAVLVAADASLRLQGPGGERMMAARDFFRGFLETALAPDELITEIRLPRSGPDGFSYQKFQRRAQDWAVVGALALRLGGRVRVSLVGMAPVPWRAGATEAALAEGASAAEAAALADEGTDPPGDHLAGPEFRRHLARVLVRRALEALAGPPGG
jgi:carbon-monoxide dehydrogenase medium subunit